MQYVTTRFYIYFIHIVYVNLKKKKKGMVWDSIFWGQIETPEDFYLSSFSHLDWWDTPKNLPHTDFSNPGQKTAENRI